MPAASPFTTQALSFFRQLAKNNRREWFQPRKEKFDELVRGPMLELVGRVNDDLRKIAVDYVYENPAKAMYRIYRDTRFSKDKTPYKTHVSAHFQHQKLPKNRAGGLYFSVSHTEVEIAGGIYMPGPDELAAVRNAIADGPKSFEAIIRRPALVRQFGPLQGVATTRMPKAYPPDHPAAEWLKMKQYFFGETLPAAEALKPGFQKRVTDSFRLLLPVVDYFNSAVLATLMPEKSDRPKRPEPIF